MELQFLGYMSICGYSFDSAEKAHVCQGQEGAAVMKQSKGLVVSLSQTALLQASGSIVGLETLRDVGV